MEKLLDYKEAKLIFENIVNQSKFHLTHHGSSYNTPY